MRCTTQNVWDKNLVSGKAVGGNVALNGILNAFSCQQLPVLYAVIERNDVSLILHYFSPQYQHRSCFKKL